MFGQNLNNNNLNSSIFGSNSNSNNNNNSLFSSNNNNNTSSNSIFGVNSNTNQSSSLFKSSNPFGGSSNLSNNALNFGSNTNTGSSLFTNAGSSNTSFTGGNASFGALSNTFGSQSFGQQQPGTAHTAFKVVSYQDKVNIAGMVRLMHYRVNVITAMDAYKNKSLGELRLEDYAQNRRKNFSNTGSVIGGGLLRPSPSFSTSSSGLFGNTGATMSNNSQTSGSMFGTSSNTNTFSTGSGLFGSNNQNKNAFGSSTTSGSSIFGTNTSNTQQSSGSIFNTSGSNMFNKPSIFGSNTSNTNSSGGLFGAQNTANQNQQQRSGFNLFNPNNNANQNAQSNTGSGLFGSNNNNSSLSFGSNNPNQASGGLFGSNNNKPNTGLFNSSSNNLFGNQNLSSSFFGSSNANQQQAQQSSGFNFGGSTTNNISNTNTGGLFGSSNNQNTAGTSLSLFSNSLKTNTAGGSLFGTNTSSGFNFGSTGGTTQSQFGSQSFNNQASNQQIGILVQSPKAAASPMQEILNYSSPYGVTRKPRRYSFVQSEADATVDEKEKTMPFADVSTDPKQLKKLIIKSTNYKLADDPFSNSFTPNKNDEINLENDESSHIRLLQKSRVNSNKRQSSIKNPADGLNPLDKSDSSNFNSSFTVIRDRKKLIDYQDSIIQNVLSNTSQNINLNMTGLSFQEPHTMDRFSYTPQKRKNGGNVSISEHIFGRDSLEKSMVNQMNETLQDKLGDNDEVQTEESSDEIIHPAGILATRPDYYTVPSLDVLANMVSSDGSCCIKDFVIGREHFGSLFFPGMTDVSNLNIDRDVHFKKRKVSVYPQSQYKPPLGLGLNKECIVELQNIWPARRDNKNQKMTELKSQQIIESFRSKLVKMNEQSDSDFISYDEKQGTWTFKVKHFSDYGLSDLSDDDEYGDSNYNDKNLYSSSINFDLSKTSKEMNKMLMVTSELGLSTQSDENSSTSLPSSSCSQSENGETSLPLQEDMNDMNNLFNITLDSKIDYNAPPNFSREQRNFSNFYFGNIITVKKKKLFFDSNLYDHEDIIQASAVESIEQTISIIEQYDKSSTKSISPQQLINKLLAQFNESQSSHFFNLSSILDLLNILHVPNESQLQSYQNDKKQSIFDQVLTYFHQINLKLLDTININQFENRSLVYKLKLLLSVGDLKTASKFIAQQFDSPLIASLLIACAYSSERQTMLRSQINVWNKKNALPLINPQLANLLMLISGLTSVIPTKNGEKNILSSDLNWSQALVIFMTFRCDRSMPVEEIFSKFIEFFTADQILNERNQKNLQPLPFYAYGEQINSNSSTQAKDFRYTLLAMFCSKSTDSENFDSECFYPDNFLGNFASWLCCYLVNSFQLCSYTLKSEFEELTVNFAAQLQNYGGSIQSVLKLVEFMDDSYLKFSFKNEILLRNHRKLDMNIHELKSNSNLRFVNLPFFFENFYEKSAELFGNSLRNSNTLKEFIDQLSYLMENYTLSYTLSNDLSLILMCTKILLQKLNKNNDNSNNNEDSQISAEAKEKAIFALNKCKIINEPAKHILCARLIHDHCDS